MDDKVNMKKFENLLIQAKLYIKNHSDILRRLMNAISENGELIVSKLEEQDYSNEGVLNRDRFKAALRIT